MRFTKKTKKYVKNMSILWDAHVKKVFIAIFALINSILNVRFVDKLLRIMK